MSVVIGESGPGRFKRRCRLVNSKAEARELFATPESDGRVDCERHGRRWCKRRSDGKSESIKSGSSGGIWFGLLERRSLSELFQASEQHKTLQNHSNKLLLL